MRTIQYSEGACSPHWAMLFVEVDGNSEETVVTTVTCKLFPTPTRDYLTFDSVTVTLLNDEPSYLGYK